MCELIYKLGVHKNDKFFENKITADEFNYLTNSVGWGTREIFIVQEALNNTLYFISVYDLEELSEIKQFSYIFKMLWSYLNIRTNI